MPAPPRCRNGVHSPYLPACEFLAPGDPNDIAPCGESVSSPSLVLSSKWSSASIPTEDLKSHHLEPVLSTHMGLPSSNREDQSGRYPWANWTHAMGLVHLTIVGVSFWSPPPKRKETSSGHAVVPKEREPRSAPRSPPRHRTFRSRPYSAAYPSSHDGGPTWDLVGQVFSPFSPDDPTRHPVCPPWILVHPTEKGWSPNLGASDAFGSWRTYKAES